MKEERKDIGFEDFLKDVELHKAPDSFTDNVMHKIAAEQDKQTYTKFWLVYGLSIVGIISSYFLFSTNSTNELADDSTKYFDVLSQYFTQLSLPQIDFKIPLLLSFVVATMFILLLIDNRYRKNLSLKLN